jgi:hypothetical protein
MKTNLLLILFPLVVVSCCHIQGNVAFKDGTTAQFSCDRAIWSTDEYSFTYNTNGVITLTAQKSSADAQAMGAIAQGVATAVLRSTTP